MCPCLNIVGMEPKAFSTLQAVKFMLRLSSSSLIIVTSAHHVPRAFLEMRRAMHAIRLSAYPVVPENVRMEAWWRYPGTFSLLLGEYVRYIWSLTGLPVFT